MGYPYLARRQIDKGLICKNDSDIRLWRSFALVHGSGFLHVDCPCNRLLVVVCHLQLEDTVGLEEFIYNSEHTGEWH